MGRKGMWRYPLKTSLVPSEVCKGSVLDAWKWGVKSVEFQADCCWGVAGVETVRLGEVISGEDPGHTQQWAGGAEEGGIPQCLQLLPLDLCSFHGQPLYFVLLPAALSTWSLTQSLSLVSRYLCWITNRKQSKTDFIHWNGLGWRKISKSWNQTHLSENNPLFVDAAVCFHLLRSKICSSDFWRKKNLFVKNEYFHQQWKWWLWNNYGQNHLIVILF